LHSPWTRESKSSEGRYEDQSGVSVRPSLHQPGGSCGLFMSVHKWSNAAGLLQSRCRASVPSDVLPGGGTLHHATSSTDGPPGRHEIVPANQDVRPTWKLSMAAGLWLTACGTSDAGFISHGQPECISLIVHGDDGIDRNTACAPAPSHVVRRPGTPAACEERHRQWGCATHTLDERAPIG
jgi:hypothetical protein